MRLLRGDCREVLKTLADNSVDAVVTDPPYHLTSGKGSTRGFMGKEWDGGDIAQNPAVWKECLRVLKPGGHLLAFSGTRTQHRMVCAIEDAGFEIRDMVAWVFGQGFPKSLDVSKAIDRAAGAERVVLGVAGKTGGGRNCMEGGDLSGEYMATAPATEQARQWQGWGTALKPAWECVTVARRPLEGTVAANVLKWGTGAINVDACRVGTESRPNIQSKTKDGAFAGVFREGSASAGDTSLGRWPANLILSYPEDEYKLWADATPEQKREIYRWLSENA